MKHTLLATAFVVGCTFSAAAAGPAFVGRIAATLTRGGQTQTFTYTAGTNTLRIERGETDWPHARNLLDRETGALTLLFPHNRSFVRLKPAAEMPGRDRSPSGPSFPGAPSPSGPPLQPTAAGTSLASGGRLGEASLPAIPPGIGPQAGATPPGAPAMPAMPAPPAGLPPGVGPQPASAMPAMPMMPMPPMEKAELKATGESTNLLGYACARYELKQRGEVMEIWATDQLLPYQAWRQNQALRFGPQMLEEQWGELVKAKKLFPLLATLKFENGPERLRFEVKSVTPGKIEDRDGALFQPPAAYHEVHALPF